MKTNYVMQTLVMVLLVFNSNAQQGFNYKAIIHNDNDEPIVNTLVTVQFTILKDGAIPVYREMHNSATNANGILIVNIGEGSIISGEFNAIDWGSSPHFLKTEIDAGNGLTEMGTTEFKTVPYALHAKTANKAISDDVNDADADPTNELQSITLIDKTLNLSDGGSVELPSGIFEGGTYFYIDKDEDGYGNPFKPVFVPNGVNKPSYAVIDFSDCNDEDENINPGAPEITDGIDNNCNGEIDEME